MTLWTDVTRDGDSVVVRLRGEFDFAYRDDVVDLAMPELRTATTVIMDLSELTFIDSSGLSALVRIHQSAGELGRGFQLRGATGTVLRVLKLTRLEMLGHTEGTQA